MFDRSDKSPIFDTSDKSDKSDKSDTPDKRRHTHCLIIGAGPYGIALANQLQEQGKPFIIIGEAFSLWFDHTHQKMPIRSDWQTSQVYSPSGKYCFKSYIQQRFPTTWQHQLDHRIDGTVFRGYLEQVQQQLPYPIIDSPVIGLSKQDNGDFKAELTNGSVVIASNVVLATGIEPHGYLPVDLQALPAHLCMHSWRLEDFIACKNQRILIIGRGQSAAEAIAHLSVDNQVSWVCRQAPKFYNEPINLPAPVFKALRYLSRIYYYLPTRLHQRLARTFTQVTVTPDMQPKIAHVPQIRLDAKALGLSVEQDKVVSSGLSQTFDLVIAATGYRYQLANFSFLSSNIRQQLATNETRCPGVDSGFESAVEGLYMMGGITEPSHGPAMRFMMGAPYAAQTIAKRVSRP